jgi:hypothetical protein
LEVTELELEDDLNELVDTLDDEFLEDTELLDDA